MPTPRYPMLSTLTVRQQRFVEEYVSCRNAAEAYRRAGYTAKKSHTASVNAARLMARDSIRAASPCDQREETSCQAAATVAARRSAG